jgi:nitronate monooxygenase
MWSQTEVTRRLSIQYPIIQGPFGGGLSSIALVKAVSDAGGLGSFGAHHLSAQQILELGKDLHKQTAKPFALNLWVSNQDAKGHSLTVEEFQQALEIFSPYYRALNLPLPTMPERFGYTFEEQIEAVLKVRPAAFSFVYGIPSRDILRECARLGITTIGTATTLDEALALEQAGVDLIVVTGFEAGGHRVSFLQSSDDSLTGSFALIPTVAAKIKAPIIAAGGIANARGLAAAFILGAQAVQIGTAFLACTESNASSIHKQILFSDRAQYTQLTRAFSGRLARGIRNQFVDEWQSKTENILPYPIQSWFTNSFKSAATEQGQFELMSLWASQASPLLKHKDATEFFNQLIQETDLIFKNDL